MLIRIFTIALCLALVSCISIEENEYQPLYNWSKQNFSGVPSDNEVLGRCLRYSTANGRYGEIIGCQDTKVFDVRNPELKEFTEKKLIEQACTGNIKNAGNRFYIRTNRHFFFLDKQLRTFWYVPEGYYSDGVSIPDGLLQILPGPIWDPATPKTLPAALVHDRYLCLRKRTADLQKAQAMEHIYRRQSCTNTAFDNGLKTGGTTNTIGALMYTGVSLANRERSGYCPKRQYNDVAVVEERLSSAIPGLKEIRKDLPSCLAQEPDMLCLSHPKNLEWLRDNRNVEKVPLVWQTLIEKMYCLELGAAAGKLAETTQENRLIEEQAWCRNRQVEFLQCADGDFSVKCQPSTFHAGDLWIEGSGLLARTDTKQPGGLSPVALLSIIGPADNMNSAMDALIKWNKDNPIGRQ